MVISSGENCRLLIFRAFPSGKFYGLYQALCLHTQYPPKPLHKKLSSWLTHVCPLIYHSGRMSKFFDQKLVGKLTVILKWKTYLRNSGRGLRLAGNISALDLLFWDTNTSEFKPTDFRLWKSQKYLWTQSEHPNWVVPDTLNSKCAWYLLFFTCYLYLTLSDLLFQDTN